MDRKGNTKVYMSNKIYSWITVLISVILVVLSVGRGRIVYAAGSEKEAIDFKRLYSTLIEDNDLYAKELLFSGVVSSFMSSDKDGIYIYVPDDPDGGTGSGVGFYRQDEDEYCIYYGEFANFQRHGQGSVIDAYRDSGEEWSDCFYGVWEDDYPNGVGKRYYSYESKEQIQSIETTGVYDKDGFTGTMISNYTVYSGYNAGSVTETSKYVDSYGEGKFSKNCYYDDGAVIEATWNMSNGYPVTDRTDEYLALFGTPNNVDTSQLAIVGWSDNGIHYVLVPRTEPWTYGFHYFLALQKTSDSGTEKETNEETNEDTNEDTSHDSSADVDALLDEAFDAFAANDYAKAYDIYSELAENGNSRAQVFMGNLYRDGLGVDCDPDKALEWYKKAADQGDPAGAVNIGVMYRDGDGVERDYEEAVKWLQMAADEGDDFGQCYLAEMYYEGWGVEKDVEKARELAQKAADQGNIIAADDLEKWGF